MASGQIPEQLFRQLRASEHEGQIWSGDAIEFTQPWMLTGRRGRLRIVGDATETVSKKILLKIDR